MTVFDVPLGMDGDCGREDRSRAGIPDGISVPSVATTSIGFASSNISSSTGMTVAERVLPRELNFRPLLRIVALNWSLGESVACTIGLSSSPTL